MHFLKLPACGDVRVLLVLSFLTTGLVPSTSWSATTLVDHRDDSACDPSAPPWLKDLVIYEIATKSFTSPNGPGSGTFASLQAKLPYLQDLGITGIWLTGHSVSDPRHFFNIWTQYATIEPDKFDPSLGTAIEFKSLVDEAHRRNIKVFLDVITHGVMPSSSLLKNHPEWFRSGSWGMVDYDWHGGHEDLDNWWVNVWTSYVIDYGVDGFRLDLSMDRADLWARIRRNAGAAGHPIIIFAENSPIVSGVTDFMQKGNVLSDQGTGELRTRLIDNVPEFYRQQFRHGGNYDVTIEYSDPSKTERHAAGGESIPVEIRGFTKNRISYQPSLPTGESEIHLVVDNVAKAAIKDVVVARLDDAGPEIPRRWAYARNDAAPLKVEGTAPKLDLYLSAQHGWSPSVQLSCHDNGWIGFPPGDSPYAAQGSRAIFGYSFLFTPMVPIFMAGEEFDADFHALPDLSPDIFGGKDPGKGRWLYGGQLDWSELERMRHRSMLDDVRKMLSIRTQTDSVLSAEMCSEGEPRLKAVQYTSDITVPVPYMRWKGTTAIIVAANRSKDKDAKITLHVPLETLTHGEDDLSFRVTDLWNDSGAKMYTKEQLVHLPVHVKKDNSPAGGLAVLKIEALRKP